MENFNIKRFGAYLVSDAKRVWSNCWISLLVVAAMPAIQYFFNGVFRVLFGQEWAGQSYPVRIALFGAILLVVCIVFPAKAYGYVTEKRAGSDYILLPVSTLEKTLSMLLNCCVAIPVVFLAGYGLLDFLICSFDSTCGRAVFDFSAITSLVDHYAGPDKIHDAIQSLMNPLFYIDDVIEIILIFLLGAICFKKGKVAKTILTFVGVSVVISMITTPIIKGIIGDVDPSNVEAVFDKLAWLLKHPVLVDTLNDTIINLALCVAIFFRVKKIKF